MWIKKTAAVMIVAAALAAGHAMAAEPADLIFTQNPNGKYIYCNNHERIRSTDLADRSTQYSKFLMNNESLGADKYALFASFMNQTNLDSNNEETGQNGFDIEVDVLFSAQEDTTITIERLGFEVPEHNLIYNNTSQFYTEDEWGCFDCWATYLGYPIKQINSGNVYEPHGFKSVTIEIKAGEAVWLSDYIENYRVVPLARSVNIMTDFTIESGVCDVNVAALKALGTPGDRSNFNPNSAYGRFVRDRQYKGISNGLNEVTANVEYTVDDSDTAGKLPVTVYNYYMPEGNTVTDWYTHLNGRNDPWSYELCADSDMLAFDYYDPTKRDYYGSDVAETDKDDYYHFDIMHTDLTEYKSEYGSARTYAPNAELTDDTPKDYACNLANYGVIYNYNVKITNNGNIRRYFVYKLATSSDNIVWVKDKDGNIVNGEILSKGRKDTRISDDMACVTVPAQSVTEFTICVALTPNYPGGMQNAFYLSDSPSLIETYQTERGGLRRDRYFTGREYYKWDSNELYLSTDRETWVKKSLPTVIASAIRGMENEYSLTWTGDGYIIRPTLYDAGSYSHMNSRFRDGYLIDENFGLVAKYTFGSYPQGILCADGTYFAKVAGTTFSSKDFKKWTVTEHDLPCFNYGYVTAVTDDGKIKLSNDNETFYEVRYTGFKPDYIDALGDYYYCADGRTLYLSENGVYWRSLTYGEKINGFEISDGKVTVNNGESQPLPEFNDNILINVDGQFIATENEGLLINNSPYIPLRETAELLGYEVGWDDGTVTLSKDGTDIAVTATDGMFQTANGVTYAPLNVLTRRLDRAVTYDSAGRCAMIYNK